MLKQVWSLVIVTWLLMSGSVFAQIDNTGCVAAGFGIDADLYSGLLQFGDHNGDNPIGTDDWFQGSTGRGVLDESQTAALQSLLQAPGNPSFEVRMSESLSTIVDGRIWIDALYARDNFGGQGGIDQTSYVQASKNGENPASWATGPSNVGGKVDLIDVAGMMRRDGTTLQGDLWFYGLAIRADPGGAAYLDFEFFIEEVQYNPATGFTNGGPNLGHTAFLFDPSGAITRIGDFIYNVSMINGGSTADIQMRIWVSRATYNAFRTSPPANLPFLFGPEFDGAFNNSPFGYASILPLSATDACGYINLDGEIPSAPPWGHKGTGSNVYSTTLQPFAVTELALNMTSYGIDHVTILGLDECDFPIQTFIVKSRASASFTAQLKDFAGPYAWAQPFFSSQILGPPVLSCLNPTTQIGGFPDRDDVIYNWTTINGNIVSSPNDQTITVDQPGTYVVEVELPDGCSVSSQVIEVGYDLTRPFITGLDLSPSVSCTGSDGTVLSQVTGGTAPFTYEWSGPNSFSSTNQMIESLEPGIYSVTATDVWGCTIEESVEVLAGTPIDVSSAQINNGCFGFNQGSITQTVDGNGPFTYQWSNNNLTKDIVNLSSGTYSVTIVDSDGCEAVETYVVTSPPQISASFVKVDDPGNDGNGSAEVIPSGGTAPYTFNWSGPDMFASTDPQITDLGFGSYTVTVTDDNSCTNVFSVFIFEKEICNDGIDNSGNGLIDCDDPDCMVDPTGPIASSSLTTCIGEIDITYSVVSDPMVDSYVWTVPSGAMIVGGQGTSALEVLWNTTQGGQVCVRAEIDGCFSTPVCLLVIPQDIPPAPVDITID